VRVTVDDDGTLRFTDTDGRVLPENVIQKAKRAKGDEIRQLIVNACNTVNCPIEELGQIHAALGSLPWILFYHRRFLPLSALSRSEAG
jgi:hypothetical protein